MTDEQRKLVNDLCADILNPVVINTHDKLEGEYITRDDQLRNKLYDKIDDQLKLHDKAMRQLIIKDFEAVLDKYILKLDNVYNLDGNLTIDVEWEEIDPLDKNPSTQTIAEGTEEVKLDRWGLKILAWAYSREIISGLEFKMMIDSGHVFPKLDQYQDQIIDELLERNDWEFLKEREVTGE